LSIAVYRAPHSRRNGVSSRAEGCTLQTTACGTDVPPRVAERRRLLWKRRRRQFLAHGCRRRRNEVRSMNQGPHDPLEPRETHPPSHRSWARLVPALILLAALVTFVVQNTRIVRIHFLVWHADMRVAIALIIAGALGIVVGRLLPR